MKKQKTLVLLLIFAMALSLLPQSAFAAKKKVKLNKKNGNSKRWKDSKNQTAKQQKEGEVDGRFRQEKFET